MKGKFKTIFLKVTCIFVLTALGITQPGCWDRREVDELGIILAIGVESAPNNKVRVIVQNINPSALKGGGGGDGGGGGGGGSPDKAYRNRSAEGNTIMDAIREMSRESPRRLFFAHNQVILISEELARTRGLQEIVDFFERNPEIRRTNWVLVTRGDLSSLLDEPGRLEPTPAQRIFGIIKERHAISTCPVQRLGDFLKLMESKSTQPFTSILETKKNTATPKEQQHKQMQEGPTELHNVMKITDTALFKQDKMVGTLNAPESRGVMWVRNEVESGVIDINSPQGKGIITLEIMKSKSKLSPDVIDGQIIMNVLVNLNTNLVETTVPLDISKPETIKELEELLSRAVQGEIKASLAKAQQEYGLDVFGFGEALHRKEPKIWKGMSDKWSEYFPGVVVLVEVKSKIERTGLISKPLKPMQK